MYFLLALDFVPLFLYENPMRPMATYAYTYEYCNSSLLKIYRSLFFLI
jgi:hypothetical protein